MNESNQYAHSSEPARVVKDIDFCEKGVALQHTWDEFNRCRSCGGWLPDSNTQFAQRLESLLNRHSQENASNTPDFILAQFLLGCLAQWNRNVQQRETWYGRDARPTSAPQGPEPTRQEGSEP